MTGNSWNHAVEILSEEAREERARLHSTGRWGGDCTYKGSCARVRAYVIRYDHPAGSGGGVISAMREVCKRHAAEFARRHGLDVPELPVSDAS